MSSIVHVGCKLGVFFVLSFWVFSDVYADYSCGGCLTDPNSRVEKQCAGDPIRGSISVYICPGTLSFNQYDDQVCSVQPSLQNVEYSGRLSSLNRYFQCPANQIWADYDNDLDLDGIKNAVDHSPAVVDPPDVDGDGIPNADDPDPYVSGVPVCDSSQNPITSNCAYPIDQGEGINCVDGTTIYPPQICAPTKWLQYQPLQPGQTATCSNGDIINYPDSCFNHFDQLSTSNFINKVGGMILGAMGPGVPKKPFELRVAGTQLDGLPSIRAITPLEVKVNTTGLSAYGKVDSAIPTISLGKAVAEYIKSAPTSTYAAAISAAAAAAGMAIIINSNTGSITPVASPVPLSTNQIADLVLRTHTQNPLPLTEIEPFIDGGDIPWLEPGLDAIQGDFERVYDPAGSQPGLNFPNIQSFVSPTYSESSEPIVSLGPDSPTQYQKAPVQPSTTLSDPTANSNPTGTDALTSPITQPSSTTPVDPNAVEVPPQPPTIYPDTWKYFDFLPMANPFVIDLSPLLPKLPETSCTYEIHRTFRVPLLGEKHFDFAPCVPLQPLRAVLDWVFAVITAWVCFTVVFRSSV